MSFLKESLYILLVGCIIYLSMFLWGSYHTSVQTEVVYTEFALLKHPVNSQYKRTENNISYFSIVATEAEVIKFYNEEFSKHGWVFAYEGQTSAIDGRGHRTMQSTHYLIYKKDKLVLRLSFGGEYSITIEQANSQ